MEVLLALPTLRERVERGSTFLDEQRPGWADEIDLGQFKFSDGRLCILGQLWGGFGRGRAALGLRPEQAIRLGFDAHFLELAAVSGISEAHEAAWRVAVLARQTKKEGVSEV